LLIYLEQNSYKNPKNNHTHIAAVAAMISGDKTYFFRVGFFGYQDTLWDNNGRHYYKLCTIQGAIDFIFGAGQSLFEVNKFSILFLFLFFSNSKEKFY